MKSTAFVATIMVCLMSVFFSDTGYAQEKGKGGSEGLKELYNAARKEGE